MLWLVLVTQQILIHKCKHKFYHYHLHSQQQHKEPTAHGQMRVSLGTAHLTIFILGTGLLTILDMAHHEQRLYNTRRCKASNDEMLIYQTLITLAKL